MTTIDGEDHHTRTALNFASQWGSLFGYSPPPLDTATSPPPPERILLVDDPQHPFRGALQQQATVIRDELQKAGFVTEGGGEASHNEVLHIPVRPGVEVEATIVNMVYSNYLGWAEEDHMEVEEEAVVPATTTTTKSSANAPTPLLFPLRYLQRRLIALGYHKNQVGTAIGIRYIKPLCGSHLLFSTGRALITGANNRRVNDILLQYGTCAYLRAAGLQGTRVKKRVCQNIVTRGKLAQGLCLSTFVQKNSSIATVTKKFIGVVVRKPELQKAALLVFQDSKLVCVATKSVEHIERVYRHIEPLFSPYYRTPEREAQEEENIRRGITERIGTKSSSSSSAKSKTTVPSSPLSAQERQARRKRKLRACGATI